MSYKTILVHVDETTNADTAIEIAAGIAVAENAHLIGLATTGVSRFLYQVAESSLHDRTVTPHLETMRKKADDALKKFHGLARQAAVNSFEEKLIEDDTAGSTAQQARYCDLVVFPQYGPGSVPSVMNSDLPAYVAMNSACPVLVVPCVASPTKACDRVLIAWNASTEATRAVRNALPLLKRAAAVKVAVFNSTSPSKTFSPDAGPNIALYLARHGIKAEVIQKTTGGDIGEALLSLASDLDSDLLVTGCYGHSRFREILLGGVTRTMLRSATVPVLMAH